MHWKFVLVGLVWAFAPLSVSFAQEADAPKAPALPRPSFPVAEPDDRWYRLIYVPYHTVKNILNDPKQVAIVPLQEYLRLWEAAREARSAMPAVVSESHYVARVEKENARIEATLNIQSVEKNWAEAIVNFGQAAIGKITSENNRVLVRGVRRGTYALMVPAAGSYKVELELSTPVRTSADGRSFDLDCPTVGITTFDVTLPEAEQAVELVPQPVFQPVEADQGHTRIKANLSATPHVAVRWRPRVGNRPELELLTGVENSLHVTIGEGIVHTDATLRYKVFRGKLSQLRLAVPAGDRILDVSSPQGSVRSWRAVKEAARQVVVVDLISPTTKEAVFECHTERPLSSEAFDVVGVDAKGNAYGIHALDAVRETGELILSHREGMEVDVELAKGLVRVEPADVPAPLRQAGSIFYRFYSPAVSLKIEARPVEPQTIVTHLTQLVYSEDELRLTANLRFDVTRTGVFEIALKVPEGLIVDSAETPAMRAYHVDAAKGRLVVTLNEKRLGSFDLLVKGHRDLAGASEIDLPLLEPLGVFHEDGTVEAFAPEGTELVSDEGKLSGAHPEGPTNSAIPPNTHRAGTWSYDHRPVKIHVKTVRKPTHLTAHIGTTIAVGQQSTSVAARVDFNIENAGIDTFRIAVPEAIADKAQITAEDNAVAVKQQFREEKAVDGWVAWTIVLQQKVTGRQSFSLKYDLKPTPVAQSATPGSSPAGKEPARAEVVVALPQPWGLANVDGTVRVPLARIEGEAAVRKDRSLSVSAVATGGDVEPIDVRELKTPDMAADLAYRYEKQPVQLKLDSVKYGVQEVVETIVSRALAEIVVGRDATAGYRCRYLIKSSQRQRLALDLPSGSTVLGVFLDGRPVSLETSPAAAKSDEWTPYFVNIVRTKPSNDPLLLTVHFRRPVSPAPFETRGGYLKLLFPRIGGADDGRVVVQQFRTAIWVPAKYVFVQSPEGFVPSLSHWQPAGLLSIAETGPSPTELDDWIGGSRGATLEFPLEGNAYAYDRLGPAESIQVTWWDMPVYTLAVSLAMAIAAWILRRGRWEFLATIVLACALAVALGALLDRGLIRHILLAARYGLVAVVAIWLIEAFHRRSIRQLHRGGNAPPPGAIPQAIVVSPPAPSGPPATTEG